MCLRVRCDFDRAIKFVANLPIRWFDLKYSRNIYIYSLSNLLGNHGKKTLRGIFMDLETREPGGLDRTIKQGSRVIDEMEGEKNLIKIWGPFRTMFHSRYFYFSSRDEKLLEICFSHSVFNLKINSNESNSLRFCWNCFENSDSINN